jgi:Uma2 family endonuclease
MSPREPEEYAPPVNQPQRHYTLDDYFAVEEMSPVKHEYFQGEIFAMAGASFDHNRIVSNLLTVLLPALRDTGCGAFGSDLRIATESELYTYPDVSVICGAPVLVPGRPDTVRNPVLLVEVLSDATRDYDRGKKLEAYRQVPSLREVLLIEQTKVQLDVWRRQHDVSWMSFTTKDVGGTLALTAVPVELPLREIYRDVLA